MKTDEHGEVCPANWDPSKEDKKMTMKADPKGKLEWFAAEAAKGAAGIKYGSYKFHAERN
jgi:alkyl hydroperoxide reductase subunit AhpC